MQSAKHILAAIALGCIAPASHAGRPLAVDDAAPVEHRLFEFEAGVNFDRDKDENHLDVPLAIAYGLVPRLEVGIGLGGQFERREDAFGNKEHVSGIGDLTVGSKLLVFNAEQAWADHAVAAALKLPTAKRSHDLGSGQVDFNAAWIVTKPITEGFNAHLNLGYTWTGGSAKSGLDDELFSGLAADYQLTGCLQLVGEVYAGMPVHYCSDTGIFLNGGLRCTVLEGLCLDAAVGTGVREPSAELLATLGLTWTFGL